MLSPIISFNYASLNKALREHEVAMTPSEMHGLLIGLFIGQRDESKRFNLLYELTNDGLAFSLELQTMLKHIQNQGDMQLTSGELDLLLSDSEDIRNKIDGLSGWINHFILGLGVTQTNIGKLDAQAKEIFDDLREIARMGYDEEDDDLASLEAPFTEVIEYLQMAIQFYHELFNPDERKTSLSTTNPSNNVSKTLQ